MLDEQGRPSFSLWQKGYKAMYVVFDLLKFNGKSLLDKPLIERKKLLDQVVIDSPGIEKILYTTQGKLLWSQVLKKGLELEGLKKLIVREKT